LTGKVQWEKQTEWFFSPVTRTPNISSPLLIDTVLYFPGRDSTLYALRVRDGKELWKRKFPIEILMRLAQVGEDVLVGGLDSVLTLVNRHDGKISSTRKLDARPIKLPLVTDSAIFIYAGDKGNEPRTLRAFSRDLSTEIWQAKTTDQAESPYFCSNRLTRLNGAILTGSYDGLILAFDERTGEFSWDLYITGPVTLVQAIDSMVLGGNLTGDVTLLRPKKGLKSQ
jgi:outer membrane protein assembly factor BamB